MSDPGGPGGPSSRVGAAGEKGSGLWKWVGGVVAAILAGVLVFILTHPGGPLNPVTPSPPAAIGAAIDNVQLSTGTPCCKFSVEVTITGFKGQKCLLSYIEIDASTGAQGTEQNAMTLTPEADTDQARGTVYAPITRAGTFVVRFILYDPKGTPRALSSLDATVSS